MTVSQLKKVLLISEHLLKYYESSTLRLVSEKFDLYLASSSKHLEDVSSEVKSCFKELFLYTPQEKNRLSPLPFQFLKTIIEKLKHDNDDDLFIICTSELNMIQASRLREHYNLGRPYYEDIILYKSKLAMKKRLQQAGISCPRYMPLEELKSLPSKETHFNHLQCVLGLPFILKPIDQSATYGVFKITQREEFEAITHTIDTHCYEAEAFISGKLFHADSLIHHGEIVYFKASQYLSSGLDFLSGRIHGSIPLRREDPLFSRIQVFTEHVLSALGRIDGSSHLEVFLNENDELIFLEVSARPPGSLVVENYKRSFGVNIVDEDLKIKLGLFSPLNESSSSYSFWAFFPWQAGFITELRTPSLKSEHTIDWFIKKDEVLPPPTCILDKTAQIFVKNENYDILMQDFLSLKEFSPLQIRPTSIK